ncbi:MAG: hypothetical protein LEGION0403_FIIPPAGN_01908 [Legionella sp.]
MRSLAKDTVLKKTAYSSPNALSRDNCDHVTFTTVPGRFISRNRRALTADISNINTTIAHI